MTGEMLKNQMEEKKIFSSTKGKKKQTNMSIGLTLVG
jgi:hypothetical protein